MQQVQDLIDERQVALFDALRELSGPNVSSRIETPQLVVVGEQNAGKSSVLEAISRFPFQVQNEICTRFPIKLILRRSDKETTHLSIEPAQQRSESDRERLRKFREQLSNLDEFPARVRRATVELMGSGSNESKEIFDDTLVVESSGPHFSQLDLVDLPGLFQVATNMQGESSKKKAAELVERHVKSKRTLVLLIVSARGDFHTRNCQGTIQELSSNDRGLPDRVIGVMTNPDRALSVSDSLKVVNGELYSTSLTHKWIVIRNQDETERGETLDQRDAKEKQFFLHDPDWRHVSPDKRGISALRTALKTAFLKHTLDSLPGVINEVRKNIRITEARLTSASTLRSTHKGRQIYLHDVAHRFEMLVGEACRGTYQDPTCKKVHPLNDDCLKCRTFFVPFGMARPSDDGLGPNLRATIRALSLEFANTMHRSGKTVQVEHDSAGQECNDGSDDDAAAGVPRPSTPQNFDLDHHDWSSVGSYISPIHSSATFSSLSSDLRTSLDPKNLSFRQLIAKWYHNHSVPELTSHEAFVDWVADQIPSWRGQEPQGEASETVYHGVFQYQSERWGKIASDHLKAVWAAVDQFVDLAMASACPDEDVRRALDTRVVQPRLNALRMESERSLRVLLGCHARGKTGFYDGFVNLEPLSLRVEKNWSIALASAAAVEAQVRDAQQSATGKDGNNKSDEGTGSSSNYRTAGFPRVVDLLVDPLLSTTIRKFTAGLLPEEIEKSLIEGVKKTVTGAVFSTSTLPGGGRPQTSAAAAAAGSSAAAAQGKFTAAITPTELHSLSAARVIEHVNMNYEISMMSFVGYVNSLVVESGILDELPTAILTQCLVIGELDEKVIDSIVKEKSEVVKKREEDKKSLETLKKVYGKLKEFSREGVVV